MDSSLRKTQASSCHCFGSSDGSCVRIMAGFGSSRIIHCPSGACAAQHGTSEPGNTVSAWGLDLPCAEVGGAARVVTALPQT